MMDFHLLRNPTKNPPKNNNNTNVFHLNWREKTIHLLIYNNIPTHIYLFICQVNLPITWPARLLPKSSSKVSDHGASSLYHITVSTLTPGDGVLTLAVCSKRAASFPGKSGYFFLAFLKIKSRSGESMCVCLGPENVRVFHHSGF